jgi:hypothetical protein
MNTVEMSAWNADWAWSLPLIVLNVVIHVFGLALITKRVVPVLSGAMERHRFLPTFAMLIGVTTLLATALHGIEAAIWATAYRLLGALPDTKSAMLYSLSAMTTYGHASLFLEARWQLMGPLEALNGMLLFGLTTAYMFAVIHKVWPLGSRELHEKTGSAS